MKIVKKGEEQGVEVHEEGSVEYKTKTQEPQVNQAKMPYEQLENIAHQLSEQVQVWMKRAKDNEVGAVFQRLNYLFKVVTLSNDCVFNTDFVGKCVEEIEEIMYPSTEELEEESKN